MSFIHGIAVIGIGVFMLWVPWAFLVYFAEVWHGDFVVTITAYLIIAYPIVSKFADMANEAFRGEDD